MRRTRRKRWWTRRRVRRTRRCTRWRPFWTSERTQVRGETLVEGPVVVEACTRRRVLHGKRRPLAPVSRCMGPTYHTYVPLTHGGL
eukprot:1769289-Pyramimonas_sp.AAC.1